MGFFTIELARRVGPDGRVVAVDVQERMLRALERRMKRRGLGDRVQTRPTDGRNLPIADLRAAVDLCTAIHVVHEVPDTARFFEQVREALKPHGTVMVVEPAGHVDEAEFEEQVRAAEAVGLAVVEGLPTVGATRQERVGFGRFHLFHLDLDSAEAEVISALDAIDTTPSATTPGKITGYWHFM